MHPFRRLPYVPDFLVLTLADVPMREEHLDLWNPRPSPNDSLVIDYIGIVVARPHDRELVIIETQPDREPDADLAFPGSHARLVPSAWTGLLTVETDELIPGQPDDAREAAYTSLLAALADGSAPWQAVRITIDDSQVEAWRLDLAAERRVTVSTYSTVNVAVIDRGVTEDLRLRSLTQDELEPLVDDPATGGRI